MDLLLCYAWKKRRNSDRADSNMKVIMSLCLLLTFMAKVAANNSLCSLKARADLLDNGTIPIRVFALDFDGTATTLESKDLFQFIYQATLQYQNGDKSTKEMIAKMSQAFIEEKNNSTNVIVKDTLRRLRHLSMKISPWKILILRKTLAKINNALQHLLNRVQNMLKGITVDGIKEIAKKKAHLCPGLTETLEHFKNNPPNVISAGPSKLYDEFVFREYNAPRNLRIYAGEFGFKNCVSTGKIVGELTAFDKEKVMAELIREHKNTTGYSVYVGNDFVDILAMLRANIGIAINYTPLFMRFLHAIGIATPSVSEWKGACSNKEYLIYTAQSWYEIEEMLFGHKK